MVPTHSKHSKRTTAKNGTRLLKPTIGLKRPEQINEGKQHDEKDKCRTNPSDTNSTTYKIPMEYFRDGTPKEWLVFKKKLSRRMTRQNATVGSTKYALVRRLLAGRALANFSHAASVHGSKTLPNYTKCIQEIRNNGWGVFLRNPETCQCKNTSPKSSRSMIISNNSHQLS